MRKLFLKSMLLLCALIVGSGDLWATDPELTLDLTSAWTAGADVAGEKVFTKTISETTYTIKGTGDKNFKFSSGYFIFGKSGAYIKLPQVDFAVEKIQVIGNAAGSAAVKMNIYVGSTAVSTETTGCGEGSSTGTASTLDYAIGSSYQAANTQYILQVTSAHNAQITYVKYFRKAEVPAGTCATPTFLPTDDAVEQGQEITISCETAGASIYYTMGVDPADPTASSTPYDPSNKPTVSAATTIKAIAVKDGLTNSAVGSKDYTIIKVATPSFTTSSGTFLNEQEVRLSCATEGASIYYTTATGDGTPADPTSSSTKYTAPFTVTETTSIKAIAIKANCTNSEISSVKYTEGELFTVAEVIAGDAQGKSGIFIEAYIVGCYKNNAFTYSDFTVESNLALADDPTETNEDNVIPVELPSGARRSALNLKDHPNYLNVAKIIYKGNGQTYFGTKGAKGALVGTEIISERVKVSSVKWSTFSDDNQALDFTGVSTVSAYMVTGASGSVLTLSPVAGSVPKNTGLLIGGTANAIVEIPVISSSSTVVSSNKLKAGTGESVAYDANAGYNYVMVANEGNAEFQIIVNGAPATVKKGKAYLALDSAPAAPSIIRIVDEENNATHIEAIDSEASAVKFIENGKLYIFRDGVVYDAMGRIAK